MEEFNITSAQYVSLENPDGTIENAEDSINITVDGVVLNVPLDPANRHYAALLEWAAEDGNTIAEAD